MSASPLQNVRHERFAQVLAGGKSFSEAYRLAGFKDDRRHASRLGTNGDVSARVAWFKTQAAAGTVLDLAERRAILAGIARDGAARAADRIAAIRADNDLAGDGSDAGAQDSLAALMRSIIIRNGGE